MKKSFLLIVLLPFFISFNTDKEPPAKYYYKDALNIKIAVHVDIDTGIYINEEKNNLYNIKAESKTYQVFYNKNFTHLAVEYIINKKENSETYKRYNRQGILVESFKQVNHTFVDCYCWFYNNGKPKEKNCNDKKNDLYADSTWYESGFLRRAYNKYSNTAQKEQFFYTNGKPELEIFLGSNFAQTRFIIEYDSISGIPAYFLTRDSTNTFFDEYGNEVRVGLRIKEAIDSVKVSKIKVVK